MLNHQKNHAKLCFPLPNHMVMHQNGAVYIENAMETAQAIIGKLESNPAWSGLVSF